ncbi:MAG TPA: hypothetical protein VJ890_13895 [Vineibacter sp.]|nr:hypothetical protein [Vineibacter sp.]
MDPTRLKHLDFIQAAIARMAAHSFAIRTLAVTVVGAIVTYAVNIKRGDVLLAGLVVVLVFWFLDSYYLYLERLFRDLYDNVRKGTGASDLNMSLASFRKGTIWFAKAFSHAILPLYGALLVVLLLGLCFARPAAS